MACDRCDALCLDWPIRTPGELEHALTVARDNLANGTLTEQPDHPDNSVLRMGRDRGWPDIVSVDFTCTTCGARFHLACETYHGGGGGWSFRPR